MTPDRQNVIRCIDAHPLASEPNMHDYNLPQFVAVNELSDAIIIFNTQKNSTQYGDEAHMAYFPFQYTFGGRPNAMNSDAKKFQTNKPIHLFARIHEPGDFVYCGRLVPLYTTPIMKGPIPTWKFTMIDLPNPPPQTFTQFLFGVYDAQPGSAAFASASVTTASASAS